MDENRVVLDTDFISGITDYRDGDSSDLFRRVFQTLGKVPVVHSFIADNELIHNPVAQALLREGVCSVYFLYRIECTRWHGWGS